MADEMKQAENVEEKKEKKVKKAQVGDKIEVKKSLFKGQKGEVLIVRENSVIIKTGVNEKTGEPIKTVVNHKNYKILKG